MANKKTKSKRFARFNKIRKTIRKRIQNRLQTIGKRVSNRSFPVVSSFFGNVSQNMKSRIQKFQKKK